MRERGTAVVRQRPEMGVGVVQVTGLIEVRRTGAIAGQVVPVRDEWRTTGLYEAISTRWAVGNDGVRKRNGP